MLFRPTLSTLLLHTYVGKTMHTLGQPYEKLFKNIILMYIERTSD